MIVLLLKVLFTHDHNDKQMFKALGIVELLDSKEAEETKDRE